MEKFYKSCKQNNSEREGWGAIERDKYKQLQKYRNKETKEFKTKTKTNR